MERALAKIWAKTATDGGEGWHPLALHLLDVAAAADAVLDREPESTRARMAAILELPWEDARGWILLLVACHDLGKACPGFQAKWPRLLKATGLRCRPRPNIRINHGFVSQIALAKLLREQDWPEELADYAADAVGCHHGERASPTSIFHLEYDRRAMGEDDWVRARRALFEALLPVFAPTRRPEKETLTGPDFMLLAGLTSFVDWIGSNEEWFPFGRPEDCDDLPRWFQRRRTSADQALDAIGWTARTPLSSGQQTFEEVFPPFSPRPLQQAMIDTLADLHQPAVLLVEAPMGEGKTEAAFFAHLELQRRLGHRGLYVALPTKATGNAMFARTLEFIRRQGSERVLDLQLLHGATLLNDLFQDLRPSGIHDPAAGGEVRAGEWFTSRKRALLSEYGVGTVDQALLPILPVRHHFVRLWGLANRVVVFDEIHAYDAYTGTLLNNLVGWLLALGSSVVLLSATLSPSIRRRLAGAVEAELPQQEEEYPRLSVFKPGVVKQTHFEADPARQLTVQLQGIEPDLPAIHAALDQCLAGGGTGLALVNTVQRAQELYRLFPGGDAIEHRGQQVGKLLLDGTEVYLFHARFPADRRQAREELALQVFGKSGRRTGRQILVATQVAEQSLDLDFDVMITDLAPIDLVLQRAGRMWRHPNRVRPVSAPILLVSGLAGDQPPLFGEPLWWGHVYREDLLLRTWSLLRERSTLTLPDEIDSLVQLVYEEVVEVPAALQDRLDSAVMDSEGKTIALRDQANQAIIGLSDDASWDQSDRFTLYDEDQPGVHRTLMALTRVGQESITAIPLWSDDEYRPECVPSFAESKRWYLRAVSLSRQSVVRKLQAGGVPSGWQKSSLLRNCVPLVLDHHGRWVEDATVRLDHALGLVFEPKDIQ